MSRIWNVKMKHHKFGRDPKIQFSNSCPYVFYKQAALKHIVKYLGKYLGWSPIFSEKQETWSDNLNWKKYPITDVSLWIMGSFPWKSKFMENKFASEFEFHMTFTVKFRKWKIIAARDGHGLKKFKMFKLQISVNRKLMILRVVT